MNEKDDQKFDEYLYELERKNNTISVLMIKLATSETLVSKVVCDPSGVPIHDSVGFVHLIDPYILVSYLLDDVSQTLECTSLVPWLRFNKNRVIKLHGSKVVTMCEPFEYLKKNYLKASAKRNELQDKGLLEMQSENYDKLMEQKMKDYMSEEEEEWEEEWEEDSLGAGMGSAASHPSDEDLGMDKAESLKAALDDFFERVIKEADTHLFHNELRYQSKITQKKQSSSEGSSFG